MKTIESVAGQTLFDIALQEMGSPGGVWDLLELNPALRLDVVIPTATTVFVPDTVIKPAVVDYYSRNNIKPISEIGSEVVYVEKGVDVIQLVNYGVSMGSKNFDGIGPFDVFNIKSVTVEYSFDPEEGIVVSCRLQKSDDGVAWVDIDDTDDTLDASESIYTYNLTGVNSKYIRFCIETEAVESTGTIDKITYTT